MPRSVDEVEFVEMCIRDSFSIEAAMSGRSESFDLLRSVLLMARMTFDASLGRSLRRCV